VVELVADTTLDSAVADAAVADVDTVVAGVPATVALCSAGVVPHSASAAIPGSQLFSVVLVNAILVHATRAFVDEVAFGFVEVPEERDDYGRYP
jgi:hypothetical protein